MLESFSECRPEDNYSIWVDYAYVWNYIQPANNFPNVGTCMPPPNPGPPGGHARAHITLGIMIRLDLSPTQ
jgi:hypothetical protein